MMRTCSLSESLLMWLTSLTSLRHPTYVQQRGGAGNLRGVAASGGFALFGIKRDAINSAEGRFTMMEWVSPDFEEVETSAEVTAYVGHW